MIAHLAVRGSEGYESQSPIARHSLAPHSRDARGYLGMQVQRLPSEYEGNQLESPLKPNVKPLHLCPRYSGCNLQQGVSYFELGPIIQ